MKKSIIKAAVVAMTVMFIYDGYILTPYSQEVRDNIHARGGEIGGAVMINNGAVRSLNTRGVTDAGIGEIGESVTINGNIQSLNIADRIIMIKNTIIRVNEETDIKGQREAIMSLDTLRENWFVSVRAVRSDNGLVATEIRTVPQ